MARTLKLFKLPDEPLIPGLRPLEKRDVPSACKLLANYLKHFQLAPQMTEDEFEYWFLTREGVIYTFVLEVRGVFVCVCLSVCMRMCVCVFSIIHTCIYTYTYTQAFPFVPVRM
jgi:glycylpeptide N-tetradecanoyltransferase